MEKLVTIGAACAYPKFAPPFREEELLNGYAEETDGPGFNPVTGGSWDDAQH